MIDRINPAQGRQQGRLVAHIADHEFDLGVQIPRFFAAPVDGLLQDVENPHLMAFCQKRIRRVRADKPRTPCDQNFHVSPLRMRSGQR